MTRNSVPNVPFFSRHKRLAGIFLLVFSSLAALLIGLRHDPVPTVHFHPDGHLSLNRLHGKPVSTKEIGNWLGGFEQQGTLVLSLHPGTSIREITLLWEETALSGTASYEWNLNGDAFQVQLPGSGSDPFPDRETMILAEDFTGDIGVMEQMDSHYGVVIFVSPSTDCETLFTCLNKHAIGGKSVLIAGKNILVFHQKHRTQRIAFLRHRDPWWKRILR